MASDAPAVVLIERALIRALLRYARRLERDVGGGRLLVSARRRAAVSAKS